MLDLLYSCFSDIDNLLVVDCALDLLHPIPDELGLIEVFYLFHFPGVITERPPPNVVIHIECAFLWGKFFAEEFSEHSFLKIIVEANKL